MKRALVVVTLLFSAACGFQHGPTAPSDIPGSSSVVAGSASLATHAGDKGFDEFGYNYTARNFIGPADGVDRVLDGKLWGDPTYANDRLKMGWSAAWDNARFHGAAWTCEAFLDNQWNGHAPGGSGETWHYRIIWVGPTLSASSCWRDGGYPVWGEFEVIMSHGTMANEHFWDAHATSSGFGGPSN